MFFDMVISSGFHPKITLPTRITDRSSTLIDNILTNDELSLDKFIDELQQADIINHLSQDTSSATNENYDKFIEIVLSAFKTFTN